MPCPLAEAMRILVAWHLDLLYSAKPETNLIEGEGGVVKICIILSHVIVNY
jgi:hypothetical protein